MGEKRHQEMDKISFHKIPYYKNFLIENGYKFSLLFNYHLIWLIIPKLNRSAFCEPKKN